MESNKILRTGVQSLDLFLGGEDNPGLPDRSVILVLGEPGTKFELFAQQILFSILRTKATEKVVYLSYDGRPQEIIEEMMIYDFNIQPFVVAGEKWEFMDAFTARIAAEGAVIGLQSLPGIEFGSDYAQDSLRYFSRVFVPSIIEYDNVCTCIHSISSMIRSNSMESVSIAIETLKHIVK